MQFINVVVGHNPQLSQGQFIPARLMIVKKELEG